MTHCIHPSPFSRRRNRWQDKRQRQLTKLANMRAAKARKRLENPPEREPKLVPWYRFELGVRDKVQGSMSYGEAWVDLRSVRDAMRRISVVMRNCK